MNDKRTISFKICHNSNKDANINMDITKKLGLDIPKENKYIIPIFIPHKGCPNDCVFCNQKKISGEIRQLTPNDIKDEIDNWISNLKNKNKPIQVAFFGGSFTGIPIEEQESFLKAANEYIHEGIIDSIKLSTRPDYITEEILTMLKKYNVKCIELGVQSMAEDVLLASKRGHSSKDVIKASKLIKKYGFELGHQVMVGLPKSTMDKEIYTIKECLKLKPDVIRIYPVYILKKSKLYDMTIKGEYIPLKLEEAVKRTEAVYKECIKKRVNVIRIGLQTTEEINEKNTDILGPVCDNYRERVLSSIAREEVIKRVSKYLVNKKVARLNLKVPQSNVNYIIGNRKENIRYIENHIK